MYNDSNKNTIYLIPLIHFIQIASTLKMVILFTFTLLACKYVLYILMGQGLNSIATPYLSRIVYDDTLIQIDHQIAVFFFHEFPNQNNDSRWNSRPQQRMKFQLAYFEIRP